MVGPNPGSPFGGDDAKLIQEFAAQTGVTFPLGIDVDSSHQLFRQGQGSAISPFPLDVVIGPDGRIAYLSREYDPDGLRAVLDALLPP